MPTPSSSHAPAGAAGGDLTGTYPNPLVAAGGVAIADLAGYPADATKFARGDSSWAAIAAVAGTSTGGLPAGPPSGTPGRIRAGSSPYDFITLYYDATLGRYVSAPFLFSFTNLQQPTTTSTSYATLTTSAQSSPWFPMKVFTDAGLSLQMRLAGIFRSGSAGVLASMAVLLQCCNAGGTQAGGTAAEVCEITSNTGSDVARDSGWTDITLATTRDFMNALLRNKVASGTATITVLTCLGRWYVTA